jgi:CRP-like cAMP-binding protein
MVDTASLQKYSLFGALLPEEIEKLLPFLVGEEFEAGDDIIVEGRPNDRMYFVLEGRFEVWKSGVRLIELGEGETFGEMEILDVMPSVATVRALTHARLAMISNRAIHSIFHLDARIFGVLMMNLARDLSRRLRHMDDVAAAAASGARQGGA